MKAYSPSQRRNPGDWRGEKRMGNLDNATQKRPDAKAQRRLEHYHGGFYIQIKKDRKLTLKIVPKEGGVHV